ncbi:unnamed protein product [Heterobilharzia americana]|nr:unnamed protein product [Heterobilharzia americana]
MSDVLDNLVISLCKFTTLLTANDNPTILPILLGRNTKACLALRLVFSISSRHADILRYGWHSLLDCLLQLFRANLLPSELLQSQDFLAPSRKVYVTTKGCIPIKKELKSSRKQKQKNPHSQNANSNRELGVFSSFYQYLTTGSSWIGSGDEEDDDDDYIGDNGHDDDDDDDDYDRVVLDKDSGISSSSFDRRSVKSSSIDSGTFSQNESKLLSSLILNQSHLLSSATRGGQLDEQTASRFASEIVLHCHVEHLIEDSKFLVDASLTELIKALLCATRGDAYATLPHNFDADSIDGLLLLQHTDSQSLQNICITSDSGITSNSSQSTVCSPETEGSAVAVVPPPQHNSTGVHRNSGSSSSPPPSLLQWTSVGAGSTTSSYYSSYNSNTTGGGGTSSVLDDCRIFCLELLIRVLMHNRDRLAGFWPLVRYYLADLLLSARSPNLLVERIIVGFLRLAICLLRRHEVTSQIFATLYWLLLNHGEQLMYYVNELSSPTALQSGNNITSPKLSNSRNFNKRPITRNNASNNSGSSINTTLLLLFKQGSRVGRQVIAGLTDLLRNHAADLPDPTTDWKLIFGLLEVCGAGRRANILRDDASKHTLRKTTENHRTQFQSNPHESNRGYTSDSETLRTVHETLPVTSISSLQLSEIQNTNGIPEENPEQTDSLSKVTELNKNDVSESYEVLPKLSIDGIQTFIDKSSLLTSPLVLSFEVAIGSRDPVTLEQAADCLAFLIRDPAHITPDNFEYAVQCLRVFVKLVSTGHQK